MRRTVLAAAMMRAPRRLNAKVRPRIKGQEEVRLQMGKPVRIDRNPFHQLDAHAELESPERAVALRFPLPTPNFGWID